MSRKKKTRRLKDKLDVKTGSKKNFFKDGQKGRIPSKNRLAKHDRQKSAYEKHLAQQKEAPPEDQEAADEAAGSDPEKDGSSS